MRMLLDHSPCVTRIAALLPLLFLCPTCGTTDIVGDADASESDTEIDCGPCDDLDPCTMDACGPDGACTHIPLDGDGDGYIAEHAPDGTTCGGDDCDDTRDDVYPGAPEVCMDGIDQDCDGSVDGLIAVTPVVTLEGGDDRTRNPVIAWSGSEFGVVWMVEGTAPSDPDSLVWG